MDRLWDGDDTPSFILVGGKGGVGKTTTSCSIAMKLASEGKKTLLISTDPAHNAGDVLGVKLSGTISQIIGSPNDNLFAIEVAPGEFIQQMLGIQDPDTLVVNKDQSSSSSSNSSKSSPFFEAPLPLDFNQLPTHMQAIAKEAKEWAETLPGVDETMVLVKILESFDTTQYKAVVFDTAPTGHTLRLLSLPSILQKIVERMQSWRVRLANYISMIGNMFSSNNGPNLASVSKRLQDMKVVVEKLQTVFSDPKKTTFVPVMIAESLSVLETERMINQLRFHKINTNIIVVNQLLDPAFIDAGESTGVISSSTVNGLSSKVSFHDRDLKEEALALCCSRSKMQQHYLSQIYELFGNNHTIIEVPALANEPKGKDGLLALSNYFHEQRVNFRHPKYGINSLKTTINETNMKAMEILATENNHSSSSINGKGDNLENEQNSKRMKNE